MTTFLVNQEVFNILIEHCSDYLVHQEIELVVDNSIERPIIKDYATGKDITEVYFNFLYMDILDKK